MRPQVGALPAGPPVQGASAVVQVFVQRFRPCSAPTLTQTSPAAHCGSPCCAIGAQDWPKPGRPSPLVPPPPPVPPPLVPAVPVVPPLAPMPLPPAPPVAASCV